MNCKEVQENLSLYLDQELSVEEMNIIKTHLDNCSVCREELTSLQETVSLLSSLEEIIPPASFRKELFAKLEKMTAQGVNSGYEEREQNWTSRFLDKFRMLRQHAVFWPATIVIVLLIVVSPVIFDGMWMGSSKSADSVMIAEEFDAGQDTMPFGESMKSAETPLIENMSNSMAPRITADSTQKRSADADAPQLMMDTADKGEQQAAFQKEESADTVAERKLIKNADLYLEVDNYETAVNSVKEEVTAYNGYITNETAYVVDEQGTKRGNLRIRIPQYSFEDFLNGLNNFGKLKNSHIYSQDVTEEYIDVESRLKTLRTKEERLLNILNQSGSLSDVLAVENELANTRAQLESLEGRMRYLQNQTEYSTADITVEEVVISTKQISVSGLQGVWLRAKEAFIKAINNIFLGLGMCIVFISTAIPYLVVAGILAAIVWGVWRGFKQRKK